ncbi:MAG: hypothetical protein LBM92_09010, partial [Opitutaceae bacterium]|nr:hypothetical protein [Opitutaceae bacterium]
GLAKSQQPEVRAAAFAALKSVAAPDDLAVLMNLQSATASRDKKSWREALAKVARSLEGDARAPALLASQAERAEGEDFKAIVAALALIGGKEAASSLTALLASPDADRRKDVIRALGGVRNKTALALLEKTAAGGQDATEKLLALRGLLDVLPQLRELSDTDKLEVLARAWELASRDEEKNAIAAELIRLKKVPQARALMDKLGINYK